MFIATLMVGAALSGFGTILRCYLRQSALLGAADACTNDRRTRCNHAGRRRDAVSHGHASRSNSPAGTACRSRQCCIPAASSAAQTGRNGPRLIACAAFVPRPHKRLHGCRQSVSCKSIPVPARVVPPHVHTEGGDPEEGEEELPELSVAQHIIAEPDFLPGGAVIDEHSACPRAAAPAILPPHQSANKLCTGVRLSCSC